MKVSDVIKSKNQNMWGIVGAEIGHIDTSTIKNITLKKGSKTTIVPISEIQTSTSLIGKRNLFLVTSIPIEANDIEGSDVFAEFD